MLRSSRPETAPPGKIGRQQPGLRQAARDQPPLGGIARQGGAGFQPRQRQHQEARGGFQPLHRAAEPEQVVGDARGQVRGGEEGRACRRLRRGGAGDEVRLLGFEHPQILDAGLAQRGRLGADAEAESAGQDLPALPVMPGEQAEHHGPRFQRRAVDERRVGGRGLRGGAFQQRRLAQQGGEQRFQIRRESGTFQQAAAGHVQQRQQARAHRAEGAGNAGIGTPALFQRVELDAGEPADQRGDTQQPAQRLHVQRAVAGGEVAGFDQQHAQRAGEQRVVGHVPCLGGAGGAGREHGHQPALRLAVQMVRQHVARRPQAAQPAGAENLRHRAGGQPPQRQGMAEAGDDPGMIAQQLEAALRAADQVGGVERQTRHGQLLRGVQAADEMRAGEDQRRRKCAFAQQGLRPVEILKRRVQQPRALGERDLQHGEFHGGEGGGERVVGALGAGAEWRGQVHLSVQ